MINRNMEWRCDFWDYISDETFERIKADFRNHLKKGLEYCRRVALDDFFTVEERLCSINDIDTVVHTQSLEHLESIKEELRAEVRDSVNEFDDDIEFLKTWVKEHGDDRNILELKWEEESKK